MTSGFGIDFCARVGLWVNVEQFLSIMFKKY